MARGPKGSTAVVRLSGGLDVFLKTKLQQQLQAGSDGGTLINGLMRMAKYSIPRLQPPPDRRHAHESK